MLTRMPVRRLCYALLFTFVLFSSVARAVCPGDCDGGGTVTVSKLIRGVNIALGNLALSQCTAFDVNQDGSVGVNELIAAVNAALGGCPSQPTPTVTAPPTATPTSDIQPIFPANYRDSFIEVRNCRLGIEHGGVMIRVLANELGAEPYRRNQNPLPVGSIIVKEEYDGTDCSNDAELTHWSAMRKEMPGFDSPDGDWHWQRVDPTRHVQCDTKGCPGFVCITCHRAPECLARDYMCTVDDTPRGTLQPVLESQPAALLSISGTSPTDVYAVGADTKDTHGPYVIHYDGSGWKRLDTGVSSGDLWWISVTPIEGSFYLAGSGGVILQYDLSNKQFTRATTPGTETLFGIWGPSASDLWAVGGDPENPDAGGVIWHFTGGTWTVQDLTGVRTDGIPLLFKVFGTSGQDVYAVGASGVILHYDGAHWSLADSGVTNNLFTVHGNGTLLGAVGGFFAQGLIIERKDDGTFQRRTPSGVPQLNGLFVPPSGDAIAVGNGLSVAARTSSGWSVVNDGSTEDRGRDFHAVWIDAQDGIWAVGGDLTIDLADGVLAYGGSQSVPGGPVQ